MKISNVVCFVGLLLVYETYGAKIHVPQHHPGLSHISRLLMGAPSVVINIEHINVDRPKELNVNIAQKDATTSAATLNNSFEANNTTKTGIRQNDKFLKNFYNESLAQDDGNKTAEHKHERKNITYFIHRLLNKRDSSYKSKIAHFKNQAEQMDNSQIRNISKIQIYDYKQTTEKQLCGNESEEDVHKNYHMKNSSYFQAEVDGELFQPLEILQNRSEVKIGIINEAHNEANNDIIAKELEKVIMTLDNDNGQLTQDTNIIEEKVNMTTDLLDTERRQNVTEDRLTKDKTTDKSSNSCEENVSSMTVGFDRTNGNMTNKQRLMNDTSMYNCENVKNFMAQNCTEKNPDLFEMKEDQHLQQISNFYQLHHNNKAVEVTNITSEECCNGNHILDILKMLDRIFTSDDAKRKYSFYQARHLKTPKDSWRFKINKHELNLTNSEIHRIIKHGFESYHNHIDGFELFECKIFKRCEGEFGTNQKREERKEKRKEKRQQEKEERKKEKRKSSERREEKKS